MEDQPLNTKEMIESTDSFKAAYESHANLIYKYLLSRTKNVQVAEDLTSSTFEKAWTSRRSFRGGSIKAWLYQIAHNVLVDYWRKSKDIASDDIESLHENTFDNTDSLIDKEIEVKRLKKALKKLPDDMREVVALRFTSGLSCRDVANKLELSENNVRVIQYRALRKLKDYLL